MKVYIDILMLTNAVITLSYLGCISAVTHEKLMPRHELTAAAMSAAGSLLLMIDCEGFWAAFAMTAGKLALVIMIVTEAFRPRSFFALAGRTAGYLLCDVVFGGCCMAWVCITHRRILFVRNFVPYFDVTLPQLGVCCALVYLSGMMLETLRRRSCARVKRYRAEYRLGAFSAEFTAIADTGNMLCDSFTGAPVVIFRSDELYTRFSLDRPEQLLFYGFRPVPFETIGGEGLIYVTSKGRVTISCTGMRRQVRCCTGILPSRGNKGYAVFNPEIL